MMIFFDLDGPLLDVSERYQILHRDLLDGGAMQLLLISLGMICLYREGISPNVFRRRSQEAAGVPASTIEVH